MLEQEPLRRRAAPGPARWWPIALLWLVACGPDDAGRPAPPTSAAPASPREADAGPPAAPAESAAERARRVHFDAIVMDTHCDALMKVVDDGVDLGARATEGHVDFPRMREGGLDVEVFAVWVPPDFWPDRARKRADEMIAAFHATVARHPDQVGLARSVADVHRLTGAGKLAAFLGIEGGHAIEDDVGALAAFHERGVRYMTLTWWNNTNWADGSGDKPKWHGLTDLGRRVVREMNRLRMVVDVSHASEETFWDVLEVTTQPVIASHSDARAVADHHRNLTDDQLRALAKNGGVVGVNLVAGFLDAEHDKAADALRTRLKPELDAIEKRHGKDRRAGRKARWAYFSEQAKQLPPVPLARVVDHIDHIVRVAGIDHVGIGTDFDGFSVGPAGITDCTKLPLLTAELLARGYSEDDVRKILGGNMLRVFAEVIGE